MSLDEMAVQTDKAEKTARRKTKRTREMIEENEKQIDILKKQHEELERDLAEQQAMQAKLGGKEALGMVVNHKKFGKGKVAKEEGKYIEVAFDRLKKTFVLPGAIAGGFLTPEDASLIEYYKKSDAICSRITKIDLQLKSNSFAIERLREQREELEERA